MSGNYNPPFDLEVRANAFDIIIRALISTMTPEQLKKFDTIIESTLRNFNSNQTLNPDKVDEIASAVRYMSSHLSR